jgi:hypothetical protein
MDTMEPIEGISLEAYAELCALMKDTGTDTEQQAAIAGQHEAKPGPAKTATSEEYARMSAMIQMGVPFETMHAEYGITGAEWSQISTAWVDALTKDPALATKYGDAVVAEREKLQA